MNSFSRLLVTPALVAVFALSASAQSADIYKNIYNSVDRNHVVEFLKDLTGVNTVSVNGQSFKITERYSAQGKANFRAYYENFFKSLNVPVQEMAYPTKHTKIEANGHNVEAVLQGQTADSVVIIIHYDSMGRVFMEKNNPAVDDDMTGMAMMLETARVLSSLKGQLHYTVRFVAADFEEWATPGLEGARTYAKYIQQLSQKQGFKILASIDDEQSGWSGASNSVIDSFPCTNDPSLPKSTVLGDLFTDTAKTYSGLGVNNGCMDENSDFYAMLEIGVPSLVFSEHNPFANPHFDREGGDTFDKIDQDYFFRISQVGVTFAARVVGVTPQLMVPLALN